MSEPKDPAIKLFGKTIPVLELPPGAPLLRSGVSDDDITVADQELASTSSNSSPPGITDSDGEDRDAFKDAQGDEQGGNDSKPEHLAGALSEGLTNPDSLASVGENRKTSSVVKESSPLRTFKPDEQSQTCDSDEKTLRKPDKILPCPRCNSMDTKFCYYNNYNVNQPRHFCKNCQRYWTAGGTMRNVPVGAGRRKNKNSSSHHHQITISESFQNPRSEVLNGVHHPPLKPNRIALAFGSDKPLCESMASALNLTDKARNGPNTAFIKPEELRIAVSYGGGESEDHSNGSSVTTSSFKEESEKSGLHNFQGFFPPQIPCYPGAPLPYPWSPTQWSSPVPPPTFLPPNFLVPFYPATAYWGCTIPSNWNFRWLQKSPSQNQSALSSGSSSPTLGKHSRDGNFVEGQLVEGQRKESNAEKCVWIPKTMRIDDPGEAAKSSIWATLGIKKDKSESVDGGLFKAFKSKGDEKNLIFQPSPALQVNPAALSRSIKFHENS